MEGPVVEQRERLTTAAAIEGYLEARRRGSTISVSDALVATRRAAPSCELMDEELAELIIRLAIVRGCNVSFDLQCREMHLPRDSSFCLVFSRCRQGHLIDDAGDILLREVTDLLTETGF